MTRDEGDILEIYSKCLEHMVEEYQSEIETTMRFILHFKRGKYPLPKENEKRRIIQAGLILYATKEPNDPFDTIYNITFVSRLSRFENKFIPCMHENKLEYNLESKQDKELLLEDFGLAVKEKYNIKPKIILYNKKFEVIFQFFMTKTEYIVI